MTKEELKQQITNEVIVKIQPIIEEVFLKGYEMGELHTALTINIDGVEYVDLGLPSGTLWSKKPLSNNPSSYSKFCHADAQRLNIPTQEQCRELLANKANINQQLNVQTNNPNVKHQETHMLTIGPNGQRLDACIGRLYAGEGCGQDTNKFWLKDEPDESHKASVLVANPTYQGMYGIDRIFTGYRLPVFLVKSKSEL